MAALPTPIMVRRFCAPLYIREEGRERCEWRHAEASHADRRRPFLQGRFIYMGESHTPNLVKSALPRGGARTHSARIGEEEEEGVGEKRTAALWLRVRTS